MSAYHRRYATRVQFHHEIVPEAPAQLLYASDGLGWGGVAVRCYQLAPYAAPPITLAENLISVLMQGTVNLTCRAEGKKHRGPSYSGNMSIQPKAIPTTWAWTDAARVLHIHILPSLLNDLVIETSRVDPARVELKGDFNFRDSLIHQIGLALAATLQSEGLFGGLYAESLAQTLTLHLLHRYSSLATIKLPHVCKLRPEQLRRVLDYIHDRLHEQLTLGELAACVGLSPTRFTRAFRESTNVTPYQYVIQSRVERAKGLLLEGRLSIAQVAQQVGFVDQSQLTRHFKRQLGVTPKVVHAARAHLKDKGMAPGG